MKSLERYARIWNEKSGNAVKQSFKLKLLRNRKEETKKTRLVAKWG